MRLWMLPLGAVELTNYGCLPAMPMRSVLLRPDAVPVQLMRFDLSALRGRETRASLEMPGPLCHLC